MIIRGTTPTMTFGLPVDMETLDIGYVIIQQNGETVIEKKTTECECGNGVVSAKFTQEETLKLSSEHKAEINLVLKTLGGDRLESNTIFETVGDTSKEGVI